MLPWMCVRGSGYCATRGHPGPRHGLEGWMPVDERDGWMDGWMVGWMHRVSGVAGWALVPVRFQTAAPCRAVPMLCHPYQGMKASASGPAR